jgi:hypothetical protein
LILFLYMHCSYLTLVPPCAPGLDQAVAVALRQGVGLVVAALVLGAFGPLLVMLSPAMARAAHFLKDGSGASDGGAGSGTGCRSGPSSGSGGGSGSGSGSGGGGGGGGCGQQSGGGGGSLDLFARVSALVSPLALALLALAAHHMAQDALLTGLAVALAVVPAVIGVLGGCRVYYVYTATWVVLILGWDAN